jgi:hypothetical protein
MRDQQNATLLELASGRRIDASICSATSGPRGRCTTAGGAPENAVVVIFVCGNPSILVARLRHRRTESYPKLREGSRIRTSRRGSHAQASFPDGLPRVSWRFKPRVHRRLDLRAVAAALSHHSRTRALRNAAPRHEQAQRGHHAIHRNAQTHSRSAQGDLRHRAASEAIGDNATAAALQGVPRVVERCRFRPT